MKNIEENINGLTNNCFLNFSNFQLINGEFHTRIVLNLIKRFSIAFIKNCIYVFCLIMDRYIDSENFSYNLSLSLICLHLFFSHCVFNDFNINLLFLNSSIQSIAVAHPDCNPVSPCTAYFSCEFRFYFL